MRIATLAIWFAAAGGAQTTVNGGRDFMGTLRATGDLSGVDFRSAGSTAPVKMGTAAARPASCLQGQIYFATDATAGQNLSFCTSSGNPGVWSAMSGGGGGGTSGPAVSYCAPAGGSGTGYACLPTPAATSYSAGVTVALVPDINGTGGATTLNVSGLGSKPVKLADGATNPGSADLAAGRLYFLTYDGAVFRLERGVQSKTAVSHQFLTAINADGTVSASQPAASDLTGLAASATTDATNASNIGSGTLGDSRLSANVPLKSGTNVFTGTVDASGAAHTTPAKTGALAMRPATCAVGEEYFASDATAGQNKYYCTGLNNWTQQAIGGGGGSASGISFCAPAGGSATAYTCAPQPALTLAAGATIAFVPDVVSGSGPTIDVSGTGAKAAVLNNGTTAASNGFFRAGMTYTLVYDGSSWRTQSNCWPAPVTGSVAYSDAALKTAAASAQFSIVPAISGDAAMESAVIQVYTRFAQSGSMTGLTWEMGRAAAGNTDEWIPAFESLGTAAAAAPQWYWEDRPARAMMGSGNSYDMYLTARSIGANLGSGAASTLTAGAIRWSIGPACYSGVQ